jgi:L-lactate utilization protein LutB
MHTRNVTKMADKRLQNNSINQNLKTIRGSIFMNRESVLKELKRMEDKQEQMENFIHKVSKNDSR